MKHPWKEAEQLERNGTSFVMVTWLAVKGHAPQDVGAKALVTPDGLYAGTVGGGKIEALCIAEAKRILASPMGFSPKIVNWNLQRDVGMSCGGEVTVLFELINPKPWRVIIFGAGHVGQSMARVFQTLNCRTTFVDSRAEWLIRLPIADHLEKVCIPEMRDYLDVLLLEKDLNPYFVLMTQGHAYDVPILREVFKKFPEAPYIGVIGSKVKAIKIRNEMMNEGFSEELVRRLRCPMGIQFGNNDPPEIAISITAELLQVRDQYLNSPD
jgi:xanthine dehydrogenase accessory factor